MTSALSKTSLPALKLLGYSTSNLPATLRNIWRDAALIDALVKFRPVAAETIRTVGLRLAMNLVSLPQKTIEGENRARIVALLQEPSLLPEDYAALATISFPLFSYTPKTDYYTSHPAEIEKLIASSPATGAEKYFGAAPDLTSHKIHYEVVSLYGPIVPLPADPPDLTLADYRLAEVTALVHLLQFASPYRLILVPGFVGTGKKSHLLKGVRERLQAQNRRFLDFDVQAMSRYTGLKLLNIELKKRPVPPVLILDEVTKVEEREIRQLKMILKDYLRKEGRKIALIGGGFHSSDYQEVLLKEDFLDLTEEDKIAVVPVEVKPLNLRQAREILTGETRMSEEEKGLFVDFVLNRIPPYLNILHKFNLPEHVTTLRDALLRFETDVENKLEEALAVAHTKPRGSENGRKLENMQGNLRKDIKNYLKKYSEQI